MKRRITTTLLLTGSFIVCLAAAANITGKWSTLLKTDDGSEILLTYNFKADGDKLTGTISATMGDFPLTNGKIKGDSIFFTVTYNGNDIPNSGRCYTDSIALNTKINDMSFHTVLKPAK